MAPEGSSFGSAPTNMGTHAHVAPQGAEESAGKTTTLLSSSCAPELSQDLRTFMLTAASAGAVDGRHCAKGDIDRDTS